MNVGPPSVATDSEPVRRIAPRKSRLPIVIPLGLTIVPQCSFAFSTYLVLGLITSAAMLGSISLFVMDFLDDKDGPAKRAARATVLGLNDRHLDTLARRRISLVTIDHCGIPDTRHGIGGFAASSRRSSLQPNPRWN